MPSTEVMNFGNPGNNIWNSLQTYRRIARPYAADVVVLGLYLNDAQPEGGGPKHTDSWLMRVFGRTALLEAFHKHVRRELSIFHAGRTPELKALLKRYHSNWHVIENDPHHEIARPYWDEAVANLRELSSEVSKDGARLVVVFFPSHEQWVRQKKARDRGEDPALLPNKVPTQDFVAEVARELDVPYLDLYEAFAASEEDPFGEVDQGHPSGRGYALAAAELARLLERLE